MGLERRTGGLTCLFVHTAISIGTIADAIHLRRKMTMKVPAELDQMADAVLRYRPKPKSKAAQRRRRKATKKAKVQR